MIRQVVGPPALSRHRILRRQPSPAARTNEPAPTPWGATRGTSLGARGVRAFALSCALVTGACLLLGGCISGASVIVNVSVPQPLVEPIDAAMGVYFDNELVNYVHEEELHDHGVYRIDIGASQAPVFAQVFDAMFRRIVPVVFANPEGQQGTPPVSDGATQSEADATTDTESPRTEEAQIPTRFSGTDGNPAPVDGIIWPSIEEVQFAIPKQTGGDFYEVWIRYKLQLFDNAGNSHGEWPLIGYGKANERNYGGVGRATPALNEATIWALRDAAAVLSFEFRDQAEVRNWLAAIKADATEGATP